MWKPDFDKWYKVDKGAYEFIFSQAEKKLEDVLSESQSITDKSIKMVTAVVAMFAFLIGFLIQKKVPIGYNIIFVVFLIADVTGIIFLIFPKHVKGRGFVPNELIPTKLDSDEDKEVQEQMLYYHAIVNLQADIQLMRKKNSDRATLYLICLIVALILFAVGVIIVIRQF
jgi:hypothetical protein